MTEFSRTFGTLCETRWVGTARQEQDLQRVAKQIVEVSEKEGVRLWLLTGPLGAGKTTLVRYLIQELGGEPGIVQSPTFLIALEYPVSRLVSRVVHVDVFRFQNPEMEWILLVEDWQSALQSGEVLVIVEWGERIEEYLVETFYGKVSLHYTGEDVRTSRTCCLEVCTRKKPHS